MAKKAGVNVNVNLKGSATVQLHLHDGGLFSLFYRSRILVPRGPHAPVLHTSVLPGQNPQSKDKRPPPSCSVDGYEADASKARAEGHALAVLTRRSRVLSGWP